MKSLIILILPPPRASSLAVKTAYVGGRKVYYMGEDEDDAGSVLPQQFQPEATTRKAGSERRASTRSSRNEMVGTLPAPADGSHAARTGDVGVYTAPGRGQPLDFVPAVAAQAVPFHSIEATSSAAVPAGQQQAAGLSPDEEAMLAKINRLRAHTQHELNRAQVLAQRQQLADGASGGEWKPAGPLEIIAFATTSVVASLLVFIRIGLPTVFL